VTAPNDPRFSFNEAVDNYDEVRPSYPPELFDVLFSLLPPQPEIVEVGPGTGQATKDLLARGASVHAIEIGPAMAGKLGTNFPTRQLQVSTGDFEMLDIEPASADAVFSATAYHWISHDAQTERPATILKPGGLVAITDLIQVSSPDDAGFFATTTPIYKRYGEAHAGPPPPERDAAQPAVRKTFEADGRFEAVTVYRYNWNQTYSATDYRKLMLSYSVTQMMHELDRAGLLDDIESLIRSDFDGTITRPLVVTLTTAVLT